METRNTILQELEQISPAVASLGTVNVFTVPEAYFDQLPYMILSRVKEEATGFEKQPDPFKVPAGYFDNLAGSILDKIRMTENVQQDQSVYQELEAISPLLNTISRQPVYAVPEGYFESLELTIPLKLDKPAARVFSFGNTKKLMRYAMAACAAGIIAVGAYLGLNGNNSPGDQISHTQAIQMNVSSELDKLSETDINSYLDETPTIGYALNVSSDDVNFDDYLEATSDEEIDQYLNEPAEPVTGGS